jgi:S-formylglutathione hydrolase FrmB
VKSQKTNRGPRCIAVALLLLGLLTSRATALRFAVTLAKNVSERPVTARLLIFLGKPGQGEPRLGPNWFDPAPFFAVDLRNTQPGDTVFFDDKALSFPKPVSSIPAGKYAIQAVLDLKADHSSIGDTPGNGCSAVVTEEIDPKQPRDVKLVIDRVIKGRQFQESDRVKLVDIESPLLTRFYGHPMHVRAGVALPKDYDVDPTRKWPVVYIIPGFGGRHFQAASMAQDWYPLPPGNIPAIKVVLDPDAPTGHHVFADSANNGPRGQSLIQELIPAIEKRFRAIAKPEARFLTGHSSGGWTSLWLQVTYPDFFGGVWSTSPDPVDFRDFQQIDLYAPGANMYADSAGKPRPLARVGTEPVLFFRPFADMEEVLGHGGQLMSFEAVFSPRGADGKPRRLWDRKTGKIDPAVARAWEKYDINLVLERNWATLGSKLRGKLHIITGALDTFYLDGAVRKIKDTLSRLGSDADVEIIPGKDHGTVITNDLRDRVGREMMESFMKNVSAGDR